MHAIAQTNNCLVPPAATAWPQMQQPLAADASRLAPTIQPHVKAMCQLLETPGACVVVTGPSGVGKSALLSHAMAMPAMDAVVQSSHHLWRPTAIKGVMGLQAFLGEHSSRHDGGWNAQVTAWCRAKRTVVWVVKGAHHLDDEQLMALCALADQAKRCAAPMRVVLLGKASLAGRLQHVSKMAEQQSGPALLSLQPMTTQQSQQFARHYMMLHGMNMAAMSMDQLMHMHQQAGGLPRALCRMMAAYSKAHMQATRPPNDKSVAVVEQGLRWCKQHPKSWWSIGMAATLMVCGLYFHVQPMMVMSVGEHAKQWVSHMRVRTTLDVASVRHAPAVRHVPQAVMHS